MKTIQTQRLSLSSLLIRDAAFILALINTPSWIQFIGDRQIRTASEAKTYLKNGPIQHENTHGFSMRKLTLLETGSPIGICGLVNRDGLPKPDLGFALLPEFEGLGYAFEAARNVLAEDVRFYNISEVSAITTLENARSIALLHRLGFRQDGEVRLPGQEEIFSYFQLAITT